MKTNEFLEKVKFGITECVGNGRGLDFDELKDAPENSKAAVPVGMEVRSGYILDAIGTIYGNKVITLHGNLSGGSSHRIEFETGDELKSIEGVRDVDYAGNKTLSQVVIRTVNGKQYGPFGEAGVGRKFKIEIPSKAKFVGLRGKADRTSVNQLGIIYADLTLFLS